jgi:cytochrome c5
MKKVLFAITLLAGFSIANAADEGQSREEISKRIKPVGQLHIGSGEPAAPAGPRSGSDVYQASCFACHGTGAMGAPKKGDVAEWEKRGAKGIDAVVANAINGFAGMPARGTCAACSDDEIKAAVEFMMK